MICIFKLRQQNINNKMSIVHSASLNKKTHNDEETYIHKTVKLQSWARYLSKMKKPKQSLTKREKL